MKRYAITEKEKAVRAFNLHYGFDKPFPADFTNSVQIGEKQAWVLRDIDGNLFLQSYGTLVSVKWADTHNHERLGRWSVTTSRHQSEFERRF